MTEFKHTIGDELYDLNAFDDVYETVAYPIVKRTERYVYVDKNPWRSELVESTDRRRIVRFSIADLENTGRAWNAANQMGVNVRPLPHWPLMGAIVRKPEQQAITS